MKDVQLNKTYDELYQLAFTDSLTGVYNRNMLEEMRPDLNKIDCFVTFVDVNKIKFVNDNYGHLAGDEILKYVADKLKTIGEYVFRLGGDEFLVIHKNPIEFEFTKSAHGTVKKTKNMSLKEAMHTADLKMYEDKQEHKNGES